MPEATVCLLSRSLDISQIITPLSPFSYTYFFFYKMDAGSS